MFKRGIASHVDWAISIGLFVVYVLLLFIFLRPGTEPVYSQSALLSIVESNLYADAKYSIEKTPLFIRPNLSNFEVDTSLIYQAAIENVNLPFEGMASSNFSFVLPNNTETPFEIELKPGAAPDALRFNATFDEGSNKNYTFFLLYTDDLEESYSKTLYQDEARLLYRPRPPLPKEVINFIFELGVPETITGFSSERFGNLGDYASLKEKWNFPNDKDFSVVIKEYGTETILSGINYETTIPSNVNVYANYYTDWILLNNTDLTPVEIEIKIW